MPGDFGGPVLLVCLLLLPLHTRRRVHRAPGIPHALLGRRFLQDSDALRREVAKTYVFCRPGLEPGPIRRGGCFERCWSTAFAQQPRPVVMGPGSRPGRQSFLLRRRRFAWLAMTTSSAKLPLTSSTGIADHAMIAATMEQGPSPS